MHTDKTNDLLDFMRGYARNNPDNRALLEQDRQWAENAKIVLSQRRMAFLNILPNELLEAIATGELVIPTLAKKING